jgi:hypothetical protein
MRTKIFSIAFAVVFIITLLAPLFSTDLRNGVVSERENRMLADRPPLSSINHPRTFIQNFNLWFNDHVGFREKSISLYQKLNRFQERGAQYRKGDVTYLVGREGHHFFTGFNHELIAKFQGRSVFSGEQMQIFARKLTAMKNYLDKKGIPLIVMFCTDKETIYPEYYSKAVRRGPEPAQLDIVTNYLQKTTSVDLFNIRQALMAQKGSYLLYPKGPSGDLAHYNEIGSFFAYRELMKHINSYFPEIVPYSLNDVDITCDENGTANVSLKEAPLYKKLDDSFFDNVTVSRPFTWEYEAFENTGAGSLTALFFRDSYMGVNGGFLEKYVARHFNKTILIHFANINNLEEYIKTFAPGIVVLETSERQITWFFNSVNGLDL